MTCTRNFYSTIKLSNFVVVGRHAGLCRGAVPFDKKRLAWLIKKKRSTLDEYARSAYNPVIARYGGVVFPGNAHRLPHLPPRSPSHSWLCSLWFWGSTFSRTAPASANSIFESSMIDHQAIVVIFFFVFLSCECNVACNLEPSYSTFLQISLHVLHLRNVTTL